MKSEFIFGRRNFVIMFFIVVSHKNILREKKWRGSIYFFNAINKPTAMKARPTKYLIDPDGYVISVNAKIDELKATLANELK